MPQLQKASKFKELLKLSAACTIGKLGQIDCVDTAARQLTATATAGSIITMLATAKSTECYSVEERPKAVAIAKLHSRIITGRAIASTLDSSEVLGNLEDNSQEGT